MKPPGAACLPACFRSKHIRQQGCINLQPFAGVYLWPGLDFDDAGPPQHLDNHCTQPRLQCFVDVCNRPVGERLHPERLCFVSVRVPLWRQRWGSHGVAIGALERVPLYLQHNDFPH